MGVAPDMLTVEEAARVVRIGRSAGYKLAGEYLATNGASGLPVKRIGGQLRVPRQALEAYIGGSITWPIPDGLPTDTAEPVTLSEPNQRTRPRATRRNGTQLALGLDA